MCVSATLLIGNQPCSVQEQGQQWDVPYQPRSPCQGGLRADEEEIPWLGQVGLGN